MTKEFRELVLQTDIEGWELISEKASLMLPQNVDKAELDQATEGIKRQLAMQIGTAILERYGALELVQHQEKVGEDWWITRVFGVQVPVGEYQVIRREVLKEKELGAWKGDL